MHGAPLYAVLALQGVDRPQHVRDLRLVPRVYLHPYRYEPRVQHQRKPHDRVMPVLLRWPLPAQLVLPVYLEVEVGAVEVGPGHVRTEALLGGVCEDLDYLLVFAAEEFASVKDLAV